MAFFKHPTVPGDALHMPFFDHQHTPADHFSLDFPVADFLDIIITFTVFEENPADGRLAPIDNGTGEMTGETVS